MPSRVIAPFKDGAYMRHRCGLTDEARYYYAQQTAAKRLLARSRGKFQNWMQLIRSEISFAIFVILCDRCTRVSNNRVRRESLGLEISSQMAKNTSRNV